MLGGGAKAGRQGSRGKEEAGKGGREEEKGGQGKVSEEAVKQQEEYEKDRVDKVEKMRIKEEAKQKRLKESTLRELWGRTIATMGPGAHKVEGSGPGKKRKRVKDNIDDSENRSARAPVIPETTGSGKIPTVPDSNRLVFIHCKAGSHMCLWDENKTSSGVVGCTLGANSWVWGARRRVRRRQEQRSCGLE